MSIEKEYFLNEMNSFIKHLTLIVLNSRISQNNMKKENKNISIQNYTIIQEKNFEIEEIFDFEDEYMFLASPNQIRQSLSEYNNGLKEYEIDIFIKQEKELILMEKWIFSYFDDIEIFKGKNYLEKKLSFLTRSIYFITRFLPLFQKKNHFNIVFKSFKKDSPNQFNGNTKMIKISNELRVKFKVEYNIEIFMKNEITQPNNNLIRQRFNSLDIGKKLLPSFEVLLTKEEEELYHNRLSKENKKKSSLKSRNLSLDIEKENNVFNFLSADEMKNLSPNFNQVLSGLSENSELSLELSIKSDNETSSLNFMINDVKEKYNKLKEKIEINKENHIGINVNKLYIYTILDYNFN